MTAIDLNQIPSGINTVEKLAAYSLSILARINPGLSVLEFPNDVQKLVQTSIFVDEQNNLPRIAQRVSLSLESDYDTDTSLPIYLKVKEISQAQLPAAFIQT